MRKISALRTELIMKKVREYRRRRERRITAALCAACPALASGIVYVLDESYTGGLNGFYAGGLTSGGAGDGAGGYGAVLLHDGANAYIMVGIAAFAAGAVITALCVKLKEKRGSKERREE